MNTSKATYRYVPPLQSYLLSCLYAIIGNSPFPSKEFPGTREYSIIFLVKKIMVTANRTSM